MEEDLGLDTHDSEKGPTSATQLFHSLFDLILVDATKFDQDVVVLVKQHLGGTIFHSKAGNNLANDLEKLARERASS